MESVAGNRGKNEGEKGLAAKKEKNFILDGFSRAGPVTPVLPADPSLSLSLSAPLQFRGWYRVLQTVFSFRSPPPW